MCVCVCVSVYTSNACLCNVQLTALALYFMMRSNTHTQTCTLEHVATVCLCVSVQCFLCNELKQWKLICSLYYRIASKIYCLSFAFSSIQILFRLLESIALFISYHLTHPILNWFFSPDPFVVVDAVVGISMIHRVYPLSSPSHHHVEKLLYKTKRLVLNITLYITL